MSASERTRMSIAPPKLGAASMCAVSFRAPDSVSALPPNR